MVRALLRRTGVSSDQSMGCDRGKYGLQVLGHHRIAPGEQRPGLGRAQQTLARAWRETELEVGTVAGAEQQALTGADCFLL